jgi:hypothetical protein
MKQGRIERRGPLIRRALCVAMIAAFAVTARSEEFTGEKTFQKLKLQAMKKIHKLVVEKYPKAVLEKIEQQARLKYPTIEIGDEISIDLNGRKISGKYNGLRKPVSGTKIMIGRSEISYEFVPKETKAKIDGTNAYDQQKYIKENYHVKKRIYRQAAEREVFKELGIVRDITTSGGRTLKDAEILTVLPVGIKARYHYRTYKLRFASLPESMREEFGYNPAEAKRYEKDLKLQRIAEQKTAAAKAAVAKQKRQAALDKKQRVKMFPSLQRNALKLMSEYRKNKITFVEKRLNKEVNIAGYINAIDYDKAGNPCAILSPYSVWMETDAFRLHMSFEEVEKLKKGEAVIVNGLLGDVGELSGTNVFIVIDCRIK